MDATRKKQDEGKGKLAVPQCLSLVEESRCSAHTTGSSRTRARRVCREEQHTGCASVRALLFLPEESVETGAPVCLGRCESAPALRKGAGDPDRPLGLPCEALVVAHLELEPQVGLQQLPPWAPFSGPRAVPPQSWCLVGDCCQLLGQREWRRCLTAKPASLPLDVGPTVGGAWWQQPLAPSSPELLALQHPSAHIASWRNIPRAHLRGALTTPEASEGYPLPGSSPTTPLCVLSLSHPSIHAPCFPTSVPLHILRTLSPAPA